jgi:poly(3-hydroxybutyrate) depolymerase
LVLMRHGCSQTPEDFATGTGMNTHADAAGLIVIYAAQGPGDDAQSCWNWFSGADQQRDRGEPAILADLARDVAARPGLVCPRARSLWPACRPVRQWR